MSFGELDVTNPYKAHVDLNAGFMVTGVISRQRDPELANDHSADVMSRIHQADVLRSIEEFKDE
jgi:hypothetical protein